MTLFLSPQSPMVSPRITYVTTPRTYITTVPHITLPISNPITPISTYYFNFPSNGIENDYISQKNMAKFLKNYFLDKWLYKNDDASRLLKFLKVEGSEVKFVKSKDEYENNDVSKDTRKVLEAKSDFIENEYFDNDVVRKLLEQLKEELNLRWVKLADSAEKRIVMGVFRRYLKKKLRDSVDF